MFNRNRPRSVAIFFLYGEGEVSPSASALDPTDFLRRCSVTGGAVGGKTGGVESSADPLRLELERRFLDVAARLGRSGVTAAADGGG